MDDSTVSDAVNISPAGEDLEMDWEPTSPVHTIITVFPVLPLLNENAAIFLPVPDWVHSPIPDWHAFIAVGNTTTLDYDRYTLSVPVSASAQLGPVLDSSYDVVDVLKRTMERPGRTRLEAASAYAARPLDVMISLDCVMLRMRQVSKFEDGSDLPVIFEVTLADWHAIGHYCGRNSWWGQLNQQIWRSDYEAFWHVRTRLRHQGIREHPFRWRPLPSESDLYLVGLSRATIGKRADSAETSRCVICLEDFEDNSGDHAAVLLKPCGHAIGLPCVRQWLEMNAICPTCRASLFKYTAQKDIDELDGSERQEIYGILTDFSADMATQATAQYISHMYRGIEVLEDAVAAQLCWRELQRGCPSYNWDRNFVQAWQRVETLIIRYPNTASLSRVERDRRLAEGLQELGRFRRADAQTARQNEPIYIQQTAFYDLPWDTSLAARDQAYERVHIESLQLAEQDAQDAANYDEDDAIYDDDEVNFEDDEVDFEDNVDRDFEADVDWES